MIIVVYFAFTTLATVGYGDYYAVNTEERIVMSLILLFGVGLFSFIMGNFIEMLMSFKEITHDNEISVNLTKWIGLLSRYNKGRPLPKKLIKKIENNFEYYWPKDKNYAFKTEGDRALFNDIPRFLKVNLLKDFLF